MTLAGRRPRDARDWNRRADRVRMRGLVVYRRLVRPLLFLLPAEWAHRLSFALLRAFAAIPGTRALLRRWCTADDATLRIEMFGRRLTSPIGLAAGFDKDALGYDALGALGFGFVEVGTLTAHPQPGNPKPRLFRLTADRALINRLGFNNRGAEAAARRLARNPQRIMVGANIGKTRAVAEPDAVADYVYSAGQLAPHADYLVVNVSSPNTPGLRDLQTVDALRPLLVAVRRAAERAAAGPVPLLVKIAPDLADRDIDAVADLALELEIDGIVATNTTVRRDGLRTSRAQLDRIGEGGLSGEPLGDRALEVLVRLRARVGARLVLIAAGGVSTPEDAWQRIRAGATLVQLYTAFVYEGPGLPRRMARALAGRARQEGYVRIQDAVGAAVASGPEAGESRNGRATGR